MLDTLEERKVMRGSLILPFSPGVGHQPGHAGTQEEDGAREWHFADSAAFSCIALL